MRVLVACEESQEVCKAFRARGHEAYSCDLLPCSGGHPEWHLQDDALRVVVSDRWPLVLSFQPCTDLAVSGARWFDAKRASGEQEKSIRFFFELWKYSNCSENPIGIMNGGEYIKKWYRDLYDEMYDSHFPFRPTQIIQPWQFGHGETKATCLWLNALPKLKHTAIDTMFERKTHVSGREARIHRMAPGPDRAKERSKTYEGIAKAMAEQWG